MASLEKGAGRVHRLDGIDGQSTHEGRFLRRLGRQQEALFSFRPRTGRQRQAAAHRAHLSRQAQLPGDQVILHALRVELAGRLQHPKGNRQVVERPLLAQVPRGEIDHRPLLRQRVAAVGNRRPDPVLALLHCRAGHPHHHRHRLPAFPRIHLYRHEPGLDPHQGAGMDGR